MTSTWKTSRVGDTEAEAVACRLVERKTVTLGWVLLHYCYGNKRGLIVVPYSIWKRERSGRPNG
jgi:hypothetical protein